MLADTSTYHQHDDEENNDAAQVGAEDSATNSVQSEGNERHQALNPLLPLMSSISWTFKGTDLAVLRSANVRMVRDKYLVLL